MLSVYFLFNDMRPRSRVNIETTTSMIQALRVNTGILFKYCHTIYLDNRNQPDLRRVCQLFRHNTVDDCCTNVDKVLSTNKYLGEKARRGILCNWGSALAHKNCMFVHHFACFQEFHPALMVDGLSEDNELMSGDHSFTFYGGTWEHYFTYIDNADHIGSRIRWRGTE